MLTTLPALCRVSLISLAYFLCEKNGVEEIVRPRPPHDDPVTLRLRDTGARAVQNVLGNLYLSSLTKNLWYEEHEQHDSGGGGDKVQGMTEAFTDTLYSLAKTSSSKSRIYRFSRARQQINLPGIMLSKKASVMPCTL